MQPKITVTNSGSFPVTHTTCSAQSSLLNRKSSTDESGITSGELERIKEWLDRAIILQAEMSLKLRSSPLKITIQASYVKPAKISSDSAHSTMTTTPALPSTIMVDITNASRARVREILSALSKGPRIFHF